MISPLGFSSLWPVHISSRARTRLELAILAGVAHSWSLCIHSLANSFLSFSVISSSFFTFLILQIANKVGFLLCADIYSDAIWKAINNCQFLPAPHPHSCPSENGFPFPVALFPSVFSLPDGILHISSLCFLQVLIILQSFCLLCFASLLMISSNEVCIKSVHRKQL